MKSIKHNLIYNVLLTGINLLFPLLSFQYVLPVLGPVGVGKTQFALSFAQYFVVIAAVGIPFYGIREVARCKFEDRKLSGLFSELVIIHVLTSILLCAIYLCVVLGFDFFKTDRQLFITGSIIVLSGFSAIEWFYNGLSEFRVLAVRSFIIKALSLGAIYVFVKSANDYFLFFFISVAATLGSNLINIILARQRVKFTLSKLNLKRHTRPLLLIMGIALGTGIYTVLDTILLGFLTNNKTVGLYTCAVKFCKLCIPFVTTLGVVLMPEMSKKITKDNLINASELLTRSFEFIVFFSVPISFGLYLLAPEAILFFSGDKYIEAINCMRILAALPFIIGLGYFFSAQVLLAGGRDKETLFSVLIGLCLFVTLNFVLVPRLLQNGAAIANVASETVVTLCYFFYIKKHYTFNIQVSAIFKNTFICLFFIPAVYLVRQAALPLFLSLTTSALVCAGVYFAMQWYLFKSAIISSLYLSAGFKQQNTGSE